MSVRFQHTWMFNFYNETKDSWNPHSLDHDSQIKLAREFTENLDDKWNKELIEEVHSPHLKPDLYLLMDIPGISDAASRYQAWKADQEKRKTSPFYSIIDKITQYITNKKPKFSPDKEVGSLSLYCNEANPGKPQYYSYEFGFYLDPKNKRKGKRLRKSNWGGEGKPKAKIQLQA